MGFSPISTEYLSEENCKNPQMFYPLVVKVCSDCFLVQTEVYADPKKIFDNYKYLSSNSQAWLNHAKAYTDMIIERLNLGENSLVTEIASNDGYLLQYFHARGIKNFGVEPASNLAQLSRERGFDVVCDFFNTDTAQKLVQQKGNADLIVGNNVLAHVPNINDFVSALKIMLKPEGTITMEFPHIMKLISEMQFDTVYHEHFSRIYR
jgi:2-polyprenyl-3-methyl-5-hydroxy-6-metoxy-1,4-benzoquinol methylase